jgi:hypothetical protein
MPTQSSVRGAAGALALVAVFVLGGSDPAAAAPTGERYRVLRPAEAVEQMLTVEATNGWVLREACVGPDGRPMLILAQLQGTGGQTTTEMGR